MIMDHDGRKDGPEPVVKLEPPEDVKLSLDFFNSSSISSASNLWPYLLKTVRYTYIFIYFFTHFPKISWFVLVVSPSSASKLIAAACNFFKTNLCPKGSVKMQRFLIHPWFVKKKGGNGL